MAYLILDMPLGFKLLCAIAHDYSETFHWFMIRKDYFLLMEIHRRDLSSARIFRSAAFLSP